MTVLQRLLLILAAAVGVALPATVAAQACPAETETGRRLVLGFATQATAARPAGVPVVTAEQVRVLAEPESTDVCTRLFHAFWTQWRNQDEAKPDWRWTFYQVEQHYYVVAHRTTAPVRRNPDGTLNISLHWSPIFIFDRGYRLVASIAR